MGIITAIYEDKDNEANDHEDDDRDSSERRSIETVITVVTVDSSIYNGDLTTIKDFYSIIISITIVKNYIRVSN